MGQFSLDTTAWSAIWTLNLAVTTGHCFWSFMTTIGILPDCANVEVRGRS